MRQAIFENHVVNARIRLNVRRCWLQLSKFGFIVTSLLIGAVPNPASASNASAGTVNTLLPLSAGPFFFNQTGTRSTPPACATNTTRWAVDTSTPVGQAMVATLLTVYSTGKTIAVQGKGTCAVWSDTETVEYINTVP